MQHYVETEAQVEPIEAGDAIQWLRLDADVSAIDAELTKSLVSAAREYCENYCDRAFAKQQWRVEMDSLCECVLPGGFVGDVVSFEYETLDGDTATVPESVYTLSRAGHLRLKGRQQWPDHNSGPGTVQIVYAVGNEFVSQDVVQAMRMLLAHYYENRQSAVVGVSAAELPIGVHALLMRHRAMAL